MTVTFESTDQARNDERRDELAKRLMGAVLGALDLQAVYLGDRLGLYRALADGGPATAPELAERAGIHPRYAREWLEHQAVGAILDVDDVTAEPDERRYTLPEGHQAVLIDPESLSLVAPHARFLVGSAQTMPELLDAYRTGAGVDRADYGPDIVEAQEAMNRPQFTHHIGEWIGALPDIEARLRSGQGRVADIACGTGWSSISLAKHFPGVEVDGIDIDEGSIARAKAHAAEEGVDGRVSFLFADGAAAQGEGRYDLVTIFEALHDMARPAEVLATARRLLAPGGAVLIADERVAETFTAPGEEMDRMSYGYSVTACLPNGLVDQPSVGTGTVLRPVALESIAREAGFGRFTILPTEHDSFRFYRLDP
jgi:2-polyprenyl-3-methyl-5-hydroxy-6-metoxy-1,4-benzoquinol methylase